MALLCGRAGCLTAENGGFRPGQYCENDLAGRERGLELITKLGAPSPKDTANGAVLASHCNADLCAAPLRYT